MAAHALTGLRQVRDDINQIDNETDLQVVEQLIAHIRSACVLSCWTEDLRLNDYNKIWEAAKSASLRFIKVQVVSMIPWAEKEWHKLGHPKTREEWHKAKFG